MSTTSLGGVIRPYLGYFALSLVMQFVTVLATLYLPSLNAAIIDNGIMASDIGYIWRVGGIMLLVALIQLASAISMIYFTVAADTAIARDLRARVYTRVQRFSSDDISHFGAPTLITRGTNDVNQVQMAITMVFEFVLAAPIMAIGGIIMALRQDAGLSWLIVVAVIALAVVVGLVMALLFPLFAGLQKRIDDINRIVREQVTGIRVVRAFAREDHETQRFEHANRRITTSALNIGRVFTVLFPVIMLILNVATAAVLWFGGQRVASGDIQVGSLTAFMQYIMLILMAMVMGSAGIVPLPRAIVCWGRIKEVLEFVGARTDTNGDADEGTDEDEPSGALVITELTYSYPGAEEPVLSEVSFTAEPGTTTAIIGSTGSGKSTLVSLIPRLREPTSGTIAVDGTPVAGMERSEIARTISMVPQKPYLFSGTVATNLRMGNSQATDEELWEALEIAQADFVEDLDMPISQGGTNVSGGQRQRLCIARMLVADPHVMLFDDSFSALDPATEARLQERLAEIARDKVVVVVAQRVASISNAQQILVMEAGRIIARGTHAELCEESETYREIVESQEGVQA